MRRVALVAALATVLSIGLSAQAFAAISSFQKFSSSTSPNMGGTVAYPIPAGLTLRAWFDSVRPDLDNDRQFATIKADVYLSKDTIAHNDATPTCTTTTITQDEGLCPAGSLVGTGTLRGVGLGLDEQMTLKAFNTPAGLTLLAQGTSPLIIRELITGTLTKLNGDPDYAYKLSFSNPSTLQSPAPGVISAWQDLNLSIPAPFFSTTGCPAGARHTRYVAEYTTSFDSAFDSVQGAVSQVPCTDVRSVQKFSLAASPDLAGTPASPTPVALSIRSWFDDVSPDLSDNVQFATVNARVFLSKDLIAHTDQFPTCAPTTIFQDEAGCPAGSDVGSGTAHGVGLGLDEDMTLKVFNTNDGLTLLVTGATPLIIRDIVPGTLTKLTDDPRYGYQLSFAQPDTLQSPAPGLIFATKDLNIAIPARSTTVAGQQIPFIGSAGCAANSWASKYAADYTVRFDHVIVSTQEVETTQPCIPTAVPPVVLEPKPVVSAKPAPAANPAPLKRFSAVFAADKRRRSRPTQPIGRLRGLVGLVGVPSGSRVRVRCVKTCATTLDEGTRWKSAKTLLKLNLSLRRATIVTVTVTAPSGATRTQRYRFVRERLGLLAHEVRA